MAVGWSSSLNRWTEVLKDSYSNSSGVGPENTLRANRCRNLHANGRLIEADVWARVEAFLSDPALTANEVQREQSARGLATGVRADLVMVERGLERLAAQEQRLVKLFRFGEVDEDMVTRELSALRRDRGRLDGERQVLVERLEKTEHSIRQLDSLADYFERVRVQLKVADFASKRIALEALGIQIIVDRNNADPGWRVYSEFDPTREFDPQSAACIGFPPSRSWASPDERCRPGPRPADLRARAPRRS